MPDRVREAVFDILGSGYDCPGELPALAVADVFAGSGSMGLEALSRGAAFCGFFERDRAALAALRQNLEALGVGAQASVVGGDAWTHALHTPSGVGYGLVFLDPPYADSDDTSYEGRVKRYLERLGAGADDTRLLVLHHRASVRYIMDVEDAWRVSDHRTFGSNGVTVFSR